MDETQRALLERVKTAKKLIAPIDGELQALLDQKLVERVLAGRGKAKQEAFALTAEGKAALKPPTKPRAPRAPKPIPASKEDLEAMERRLLARMEELLGAAPRDDAAPRALNGSETSQPATGRADFAGSIPRALRELDLAGRHGGIVPIPELRRAVLAQARATRDEFDRALLALEREFKIDLKVANEAQRPDAQDGIAVPGRGLVYYALAR